MSKKEKREAATSAAEEYNYSKGMLNAAPTKNKCDTYVRLPLGLTYFEPKDGVGYRLIFFPWKAGKNNPAAAPGGYVVNRFLFVHQGIGTDNEWHLCPSKTLGQPCEVCSQKAIFHTANRHRPWKDIEQQMKALNYKNRELFLLHDLEGKPGNLQVWEEACFSFGDNLRKWLATRTKFQNFAHPTKGLVVEVTGSERSIGTGKFTNFDMISFSEREEKDRPTTELIAKAAKFCLDDYVISTPSDKLKTKFLMAGVAPSKEEDEEDEDEKTPATPAAEEEGEEEADEKEEEIEDSDDDEEEEIEDSDDDEEEEIEDSDDDEEEEETETEEEEEETEDSDDDDEEEEETEEEETPAPPKKKKKSTETTPAPTEAPKKKKKKATT